MDACVQHKTIEKLCKRILEVIILRSTTQTCFYFTLTSSKSWQAKKKKIGCLV
jgi:hypothetical protein